MSVELLPGEEICPDCAGTGLIENHSRYQFPPMCGRCWGDGKLDWIEMAMGKPPRNPLFSANPCGTVDLYYSGTKILETTKEGGIKIYAN